MEIIKCTQCGGETSTGFLLETGHYNVRSVTIWVEGMPEKPSFWDWDNGLKLENRANLPVTAYRCIKCGHLEFYANRQKRQIVSKNK